MTEFNIMKPRPIHKLLKLALKHFDRYFLSGLCSVIDGLEDDEFISKKEQDVLHAYLNKHKPSNHASRDYELPMGVWYWKPFQKVWRLKWLEKHIELTK